MKQTLMALMALIAVCLFIANDNDPFKSNDLVFKKHTVTVKSGECLDEIFARYYSGNTVFVDWDSYRNKHYVINEKLTANNRFLQVGDIVTIVTVHKKGN